MGCALRQSILDGSVEIQGGDSTGDLNVEKIGVRFVEPLLALNCD